MQSVCDVVIVLPSMKLYRIASKNVCLNYMIGCSMVVKIFFGQLSSSPSISILLSLLPGASQIHPLPSSDPFPLFRQVSPHRPPTENPRDNCIVQTTEWSECSATCGMAISSRVTNDNQRCQLERQTRICMVRPCNSQQEKEIKVCVLL